MKLRPLLLALLCSMMTPALSAGEVIARVGTSSLLNLSQELSAIRGPWQEISSTILFFSTILMVSPDFGVYDLEKPLVCFLLEKGKKAEPVLSVHLRKGASSRPFTTGIRLDAFPVSGSDRVILAGSQEEARKVQNIPEESAGKHALYFSAENNAAAGRVLTSLLIRERMMRALLQGLLAQAQAFSLSLDFPSSGRAVFQAELKKSVPPGGPVQIAALPETCHILSGSSAGVSFTIPEQDLLLLPADFRYLTGSGMLSTDGSALLIELHLKKGGADQAERLCIAQGMERLPGGIWSGRLPFRGGATFRCFAKASGTSLLLLLNTESADALGHAEAVRLRHEKDQVLGGWYLQEKTARCFARMNRAADGSLRMKAEISSADPDGIADLFRRHLPKRTEKKVR